MNSQPEETSDDLSRRLDILDRLLFGIQKAVGHELPNQLVAQRGMLQLLELEDGGRLSADGRDYLQRAVAGMARTGALIGALTEIVRHVRQPGLPEPLDLSEVARDVAAEVIQLFPRTIIEYDFPDNLPVLVVPRRALRLVLTHLLRNAAEAAAPERPLRAVVSARSSATGVEVSVADNGRGIAPERRARLFEPFPGSDAGAGLGLFVARLLVESWGGTAAFRSELGSGATFTFTAPAAASLEPQARE